MDRLGESHSRDYLELWLNVCARIGGWRFGVSARKLRDELKASFVQQNFNDPRRATPQAGEGGGGDALASFPVDTRFHQAYLVSWGLKRQGKMPIAPP
jgi:hypothetical protein